MDIIYKFKRYEDNSLRYTGIDRHIGQDIGGWDTVMDREEYDHLFALPQVYVDPSTANESTVVEEAPVPVKKRPRQKRIHQLHHQHSPATIQ